jgi:hypothetical protein
MEGVHRVVGGGVVGHTKNREPSLHVAVLLERRDGGVVGHTHSRIFFYLKKHVKTVKEDKRRTHLASFDLLVFLDCA